MKVLYSTMSTIEDDGVCFYSNPIQATYRRYLEIGDDITVLCPCKKVEESHSDKLDKEKLRFIFVKKINTLASLFKDSSENEKIIKEAVLKSDVCVIHLPSDHGAKVIKYARLYNKPYMTIVCGCPWDALWNHGWRGKIMAAPAFYKLRRIEQRAPYTIYVTNKFLQHRYPTKGESIGCSNVNIHTGIPEVLEDRLAKLKDSAIANRRLRIGTAAGIDVAYKGQEYVIKAIALLKKKNIEFEYHLIGKGRGERLKRICEEEGVTDLVFFHGEIPHHEVLDFIDSIDVYAQPSKQEGLPRAVIEAMSRGCLCLGSKVAGIPELLEQPFVFNKGDYKRIALILEQITPSLLKQQAQRNFDYAKNFDSKILNERRSDFIRQFVRKVNS